MKWISIKDRLPDIPNGLYAGCYLCSTIFKNWVILIWSKQGVWMHNNEIINQETVTHWMPLPKPPKG